MMKRMEVEFMFLCNLNTAVTHFFSTQLTGNFIPIFSVLLRQQKISKWQAIELFQNQIA